MNSNQFNKERNEILGKMQRLCSEREKCRSDITEKLRKYSLSEGDTEWIVRRLEEDRFIDDTRYAGFYAHDKFRLNHWGKMKIRAALQMKKIDAEIISKALTSINENDYREVLQKELLAKDRQLKEKDPWKRKARLFQFASSRGFEHELIYEFIGQLPAEDQ